MKLLYLHANSHLFPRIPLQAFPRYANGACRDLCSPSPSPAYGTWTDANQSTASYYPDDPFVEQPCSTSPWTAYGPRTDATQNTASYYQDDPLVEQQCPCADSSAQAYQTHAYYDAYSPAAVPESCIPENAAACDVLGTFSITTGQPVADVSQTNVNFAHSPYCLPSGEAYGPQHPEPEPHLPSPTCSAAPGIPIVTRLADQFATLHSSAPPPGLYMLQGITICPPLIVEGSPRPPESPALRRRSNHASPRSSRASSTDGPTCISPFSTTNPFQALADLAAPDLDDRQEFLAETPQTFNSAPPGYTLVRKPLRTGAAAPMQLPKKGTDAPRPRRSRRVGTRKHPRGHRKIKGTPFADHLRQPNRELSNHNQSTLLPTRGTPFWPMTSQNTRLAISLSLHAIYLVCKVHPTRAPPWRTLLRLTSHVESSGTTIVHQSQTLHFMYCLGRIVLRCRPQR